MSAVDGLDLDLERLSTPLLQSLCRELNITAPRTPSSSSRAAMLETLRARLLSGPRTRTRTRPRPRPREDGEAPLVLSPSPSSAAALAASTFATATTLTPREEAARRIWRWYRARRPARYVNDADFLTFEPLPACPPPFCLVEGPDHVYRFDPESLADWFVREGHFINPYTRRPLTGPEIRRLDRAVRRRRPDFVHLPTHCHRIGVERQQRREHERTCQLLHQESFQMVRDVLALCHRHQPLALLLAELCEVHLPRYYDRFQQLFALDHDYATESILHTFHTLDGLWQSHHARSQSGPDPWMRFPLSTAARTTRSYVLKSARDSLLLFCTQVLPVMPALMLHHAEHAMDEEPVR